MHTHDLDGNRLEGKEAEEKISSRKFRAKMVKGFIILISLLVAVFVFG